MKQKDSEPMKKKSSNVFPKKGATKDWGSCGMLQKNQFGFPQVKGASWRLSLVDRMLRRELGNLQWFHLLTLNVNDASSFRNLAENFSRRCSKTSHTLILM